MSDTPADGAPAPEASPDPSAPTTEPADDGTKLLAQLRQEAAKERKARQALEKQLAEFQTAQLSEHERALADAEARGRAAASSEYAKVLAAAKIEARLAGVVPDPATIVDDLNLSKYLTEDGQVDTEKVEALRERFASMVTAPTPVAPSVPTGPRGSSAPAITLEQLRQLSRTNPERVEQMRRNGELDHLLTS